MEAFYPYPPEKVGKAIAISIPTRHSESWQAQLTHQIVASDRVLESKQFGSILLNSYFSGKWEYLLNHRLVEVLASEKYDLKLS